MITACGATKLIGIPVSLHHFRPIHVKQRRPAITGCPPISDQDVLEAMERIPATRRYPEVWLYYIRLSNSAIFHSTFLQTQ